MAATVFIQDDGFSLLADGASIGSRRILDDTAGAQLAGFASRYALLEHRPDPEAAKALGRDLHHWLDGDQHAFSRLSEEAAPPLLLTIHCPRWHPSPTEWALLHAPWELLADERGHLAADGLLQFAPARRLGPVQTPPPLDDARLGLAFMAAAPEGVSELDYEDEEAAILNAVGTTQLDLLVEESGEAEALGQRLVEASGLPVLHLSCHGHPAWRATPAATPRPVLILEDGAGGAQPTTAAELLRALRPAMPRLLFLSACSSAAATSQADPHAGLPPARDHKAADGGPAMPAPQTATHSLTSALIAAGLPAIIGWDGPVADTAATRFAAALYGRLAQREGLALAVAEARRRLLEAHEDTVRCNWHLARLWVGPKGHEAAPLVAGTRARSLLPADYLPEELLRKKDLLGNAVPVASHAMFVGRRRELQQALRHLKGQAHAGVLITGMGRLGKSSLAARIANRCRADLALAVLHGRFGIDDLLARLAEVLEDYPRARDLVRAGQARVRSALLTGEEGALQALGDLLTDLLHGPCRQRDEAGPALLLLLDDFEQLLAETAGVRPLQARYVGLIATILRAFDPLRTASRLLVTSRFPFRLGPAGDDPAERLARLELASFNDTAERKLTLHQQTLARGQHISALDAREALLPRARAAACGNPGLLDLLGARLLLNPVVPLAEAEAALEQMEEYLAGGDLPETEQLRQQLEAIAVQTLLELAGSAGRDLLRALTLFQLPVPEAITARLAAEVGGDLQALRALGLIEPGADPVRSGESGVRISPLAAARLPPLAPTEAAALASAVAHPLFAAWGGDAGARPAAAELQLAHLALPAKDAALAARCGANAIEALETDSYPGAAALGTDLISLLQDTETPAPPRLLAAAARVIQAAGDGATAAALLQKGMATLERSAETSDPMGAGHLFMQQADRLVRTGDLEGAAALFEKAATFADKAGNTISVAIARGRIADILEARGQLDEALRIRTEEQLPVYERLGDVRSKAITQGQIADILQARGQLDEALRIRTEEQLPVYERLGDVREKAITQGKIADILYRRGELDEALRIRTEEQLPVYERLGDVQSLLVCRAEIALSLMKRGEAEDRASANALLCLALGDARRLGIQEANQIEQILQHFEMDC
jgi:tetratricopeptide (TPR) repeat protein